MDRLGSGARLLLSAQLLLACGNELPSDIAGYRERCTLMNCSPIPVKKNDPHEGTKDVYACNVTQADLEGNVRPFEDGTLIIKESTREGASYPWLIATARKQGGRWHWDEYSRNFEDEAFLHILANESVCIDCHQGVQRPTIDWIYTQYDDCSP